MGRVERRKEGMSFDSSLEVIQGRRNGTHETEDVSSLNGSEDDRHEGGEESGEGDGEVGDPAGSNFFFFSRSVSVSHGDQSASFWSR